MDHLRREKVTAVSIHLRRKRHRHIDLIGCLRIGALNTIFVDKHRCYFILAGLQKDRRYVLLRISVGIASVHREIDVPVGIAQNLQGNHLIISPFYITEFRHVCHVLGIFLLDRGFRTILQERIDLLILFLLHIECDDPVVRLHQFFPGHLLMAHKLIQTPYVILFLPEHLVAGCHLQFDLLKAPPGI